MSYKIKFYGTDYSPIEKFLSLTKALNENGNEWILTDAEKRTILIKFLEHVQSKASSLVVNSKKNTVMELYSLIGDNKYYFSGIIGVISDTIVIPLSEIKDGSSLVNEEYEIEIILQIQSRFDVNKDGSIGKPFFLSTMLNGNNILMNEDFLPSNTEDYFFDFLLLFSFKRKLSESYLKGYYRTYSRFERNDDKIKGTIDIARHIKENMGLNTGKIAYSFRINSVDNYLNHLIIASYLYLKNKYFSIVNAFFDSDFEAKKIIDNLKNSIVYPKYDIKTIIVKNLNSISHPFYTEYESLRKICLRILRNEGISIFDGNSNDKVEGVLFYIPDLWEKYLERFLVSNNYNFCPQKQIKIIDYSNDKKYRQLTYPDYVFYLDKHGEIPFMILDAKFKEKWSEAVLNKGSFSGILEDYDKCIRDMNSINGHSTGVIFPTNNALARNPKEFIVHNISPYNKIDKFYTFAIYVPYSNGNYRDWLNEFNCCCKDVSKLIENCILKEKEFKIKLIDFDEDINLLR